MTSIRRRLVIGVALGVSLAFAISGVLVVVLARSALGTQFDEALVARAHALGAGIEQDDGNIELELDPGGARGDPALFEVWEGEHVLLRSTSLGGADLVRDPGEVAFRDVELADGAPGRQVTLRFDARREHDQENDPRPRAAITLALARPTSEVGDAVGRLAKVLIAAGAFGVLLCLAILAGVVQFGLAPVRSLAAAIAELREGDLALRRADATPVELAPVVDRLDDLLRRLSIAFERERELTAEVAHELRTPLTGLRATLEVALSKPDRPVEKYRSALAECLAITVQTERLVETMLSLARLDAGSLAAERAPVDADELVREVLAVHAARAGARQITVSTELAPVTWDTDRDKLLVVVQNLVDNAISYADPGGRIDVRLADRELVVRNTGCTLSAQDAARVFERFWRGDAARTVGSSHAGLGLALCTKLVALMGGTIGATVEDGAFVARVRL